MDKNNLITTLYNEFTAASVGFEQALDRANSSFASLTLARRNLAEAKQNLEFVTASALLAEMSEGGKINGKNAETRELQRKVTLEDLRVHVGDVALASQTVKAEEAEVALHEVEYEQAKNLLSVLRNRARMIAGLASALSD